MHHDHDAPPTTVVRDWTTDPWIRYVSTPVLRALAASGSTMAADELARRGVTP